MEDERTDKHTDGPAGRIGRFEGSIKERFDQAERRFDRFEGDVKERFARVDARFDKLEGKADTTYRTIWCGIVVAVVVKVLLG